MYGRQQHLISVSLNAPRKTNISVVADTKMMTVGKDGSIDLVPTDAELELSDFPTRCRMFLKDAKDGSDVYSGGAFTLTSTQGAPSLYALSQTRLVTPTSTGSPKSNNPSPTADATGVDGMSTSNTSPRLGSESPSASAGDTGDATAAASAASSSGALGAGARAGIIISVIIGVLFLAVGLVFFVRNRRKGRNNLLGRSGGDGAQEKFVLDLPPAPVTGEDLVVPPPVSTTTNRNSEDWRRFFGSATAAHSGK